MIGLIGDTDRCVSGPDTQVDSGEVGHRVEGQEKTPEGDRKVVWLECLVVWEGVFSTRNRHAELPFVT